MTATDLTTESELDEVLSWLDDDERYHQEQVARARKNKAAVKDTLSLLKQYRVETAPIRGDGEGETHFGVSASDIVNCPGIREALAVIACQSNGYLHYRTAGKLLREARVSKSKNLENLVGDLYRRLKRDKDWERHGPGVFKYLPYTRLDPDGTRPERAANLVPVSTTHIPPSPRVHRGNQNGKVHPT